MIEHRPILTFVSHLILVIGVAIVALPVYVTFVASSLAVDEVLQSPMPMLPGSHLIENYTKVLSQGASTHNLQRLARGMGFGPDDSSSVMRVYEALLGRKIKP